jgi:hypothetical protein
MHPVRGGMLTEEEFEFVYNLEEDLGPLTAPEENVVAEQNAAEDHQQPPDALPQELVSKLEPVNEVRPPQEDAATSEQAAGEDFIPSIKAS